MSALAIETIQPLKNCEKIARKRAKEKHQEKAKKASVVVGVKKTALSACSAELISS